MGGGNKSNWGKISPAVDAKCEGMREIRKKEKKVTKKIIEGELLRKSTKKPKYF